MKLGRQTGRRVVGTWLFAAFFLAGSSQASPPQRIMSLNLCGDVLLLHLAKPEQIASLTFLAASSPLSPVRSQAQGLPSNHGTAEEVVALNPDLVLVHRYSNTQLVQALEALGFPLWKVDAPSSLEEAATQIEAFADVLGQPERGRQTANDLRALPVIKADNAPPVAAIYGPNGMTATPGTLLHDLMQRAGMRNFAALHSLPDNGRIPLETLLQHPPQALVLSGEAHETSVTLAQQSLHHPALKQLTRDMPSSHIPGQYWSCGGPELAEAFRRLLGLRQQLGNPT